MRMYQWFEHYLLRFYNGASSDNIIYPSYYFFWLEKNYYENWSPIGTLTLDIIIMNVENARDDAKMFKAVKNLKRKPYENPIIHNEEGKTVTNPKEIYKIINQHFKNQFNKDNTEQVQRFIEPPRPLKNPISSGEIATATRKMTNNRAPGKDNISVELLKYAPDNVHRCIAEIMNSIFENHKDIDTGTGILVPLQKPPPKKKGPVKNLRPVTLLLVIRKILSRLTVTRAEGDLTNIYHIHKVHTGRTEVQLT